MTIEFPCTQCQRTLSVPDDVAGKKAKCPSCSAVLDVPQPNTDSPPPITDGSFAANPYSSPVATDMPSQSGFFPGGEIEHRIFDTTQCISDAWALFKQNAGILVGATVITMAVSMLISGVASVLQDPGNDAALVIAGAVVNLIGNIVNTFLTIGMIRLCLAVARGEPRDIGMLFSGGPYFWRYLGVSILFGIAMFVGLLLLLIPGIYVAITYWPSMFLVIDRNTRVFESLRVAGELAKGNRINSVVLGVFGLLINFAGLMMCFVGLFATIPIVYLMVVSAYLSMTGQRKLMQ